MRKYRQLRPGESSQYTTKWAREHREQDRKLKEKSRNKKRAELGLLGWTLKTKYHLTIEQYNVILEKQNGVCAICRKPPTPQKRWFSLPQLQVLTCKGGIKWQLHTHTS